MNELIHFKVVLGSVSCLTESKGKKSQTVSLSRYLWTELNFESGLMQIWYRATRSDGGIILILFSKFSSNVVRMTEGKC